MLISEIAAQNLLGFPPTARLGLKAGLNAIVSRDADIVRLLRAIYFPDSADGDVLCSAAAPRKVALTIQGRDGQNWRVIRDFNAGRSLLKSDPQTRQPVRVADEPVEITRHLAASVGVPNEAVFRAVLVLSAQDLPSRLALERKNPTREITLSATATSSVGQDPIVVTAEEARVRLPELRLELEKAERFEQAQDALYGLQQRVAELTKAGEGLAELEREIAAFDQKLAAYGRLNVDRGLEQKIRRYPEANQKRDTALAEIKKKREELEAQLGPEPRLADLVKNQFFAGGVLAGLVTTGVAVGLGIDALYLANLAGFGVAAFGAWKWVDEAEDVEHSRRRLKDLDEAQLRVQRTYEQDTQPVLAAMRELAVGTPDEVLHRLTERDMIDARKVAMVRELEQKRADPKIAAVEAERRKVEADFRQREQQVNSMGFTREKGAIRRDILACEDALSGWSASSDPDPMPAAIERAAELAGVPPPVFVEAIKDRLAQYMTALTDKRFVGVRPLGPGSYHPVAASGASGPLTGLSHPDRDAIYLAVRLACAEKAAAAHKLPLAFDEPSLLIDANHRGLFVRMLKSLGSMTQVLVRAFEPPPPGVVDHVAAPPAPGT